MAENSFQSGGQILVLAPDEHLASEITSALDEAAPAAHVLMASSLGEAQELVRHDKPDLFVLDVDASYDLGQEFLYDLRTSHPNARAIILTAIHLAAHREQAAGLGAIHFLEKPFPRADFVDLVQALLQPSGQPDSEKFQGTLSDLHIADIIQLKCMSGATAALEFTGPHGEKARVFFEDGQVRHATAPDKVGIPAFNEIVNWRGGMISEVSGVTDIPKTIDLDWQILLMEAVRSLDETRATPSPARSRPAGTSSAGKILVIDDSAMLLSFVEEILGEANYRAVTAPTGEEGLRMSESEAPDLILLDYVLPDVKGDEVCRRLLQNPVTEKIPVVFMSGFAADLRPEQLTNSNVVGFLSKPFTSETLTKMVAKYVSPGNGAATDDTISAQQPSEMAQSNYRDEPVSLERENITPDYATSEPSDSAAWQPEGPAIGSTLVSEIPLPESGTFFCGDTNFFSLHWALQTIAREKLTGTLRAFWNKEPIDLLAQRRKDRPRDYARSRPLLSGSADHARQMWMRTKSPRHARGNARPAARFFLPSRGKVDRSRARPPTCAALRAETFRPTLDRASGPFRVRTRALSYQTFAQRSSGEADIDHWALSHPALHPIPGLGRSSPNTIRPAFRLIRAMDSSACRTFDSPWPKPSLLRSSTARAPSRRSRKTCASI